MLDLSKRTYDELNNQLLEDLPILYQCTCQILAICLKEYLRAHCRLMEQVRLNTRLVFHQVIREQQNLRDLRFSLDGVANDLVENSRTISSE